MRQSEASRLKSEALQAEIQRNMKSALMRGVCALNMETMGVIQNGNDPTQQYQGAESMSVSRLLPCDNYYQAEPEQNMKEAALGLSGTGGRT